MGTSIKELSMILQRVKVESESMGLFLNVAKTKFMTTGADETEESLFVDGNEVERVTQCNFLGALITHTQEGGCNREIRRRLVMARTTLTRLAKIWTDRNVTKTTKIRLI